MTVMQPDTPEEQGTTSQPVRNPQENPLYMSLGQVARQWRKHKGTVSRHISEGKLQWHDQPDGSRKLFAPEVAKLYGALPQNGIETVSEPVQGTTPQPVSNTQDPGEIKGLRATVEAKDEVIRALQEQLADTRAQLERERDNVERERLNADRWREEFQTIKMLPAPAGQPERRSWWPFGKRGS